MASKKKPALLRNWQENYASFILGAIIVVILGLLVANFLTNRNGKLLDFGAGDAEEENFTQDDNTTPGQTAQKEYTIVADDSLSKIAEREYGDMAMWPVLVRANNIMNPNYIEVGQKVNIPSKEEAGMMHSDMTATTYKVQKDDTLFMVAEKMYGDGSKWGLIAKANKVGRLPNGNPLIFVDQTLNIPR